MAVMVAIIIDVLVDIIRTPIFCFDFALPAMYLQMSNASITRLFKLNFTILPSVRYCSKHI